MGRTEIFQVYEFLSYVEEEPYTGDQLSAAREMLERYSEENYGLSPTGALLDSGSVTGTATPVTNMSIYDAYGHLLEEQETELKAPSYLHSRGKAKPDRHLREAADHVERFLRDERGRDYEDIFGPVAAI